MHISEGILSVPVLVSGGALAGLGTAIGLKNLDYDRIAGVGVLSSAFFVASLIHINIGPASVHLILNGIVGLMLGWIAFPAILVALTLQAVFFQFGGITTLGINTVNMALPAVVCYALFRRMLWKSNVIWVSAAFLTGFLSVLFAAVMVGLSLIFTEQGFFEVTALIVGATVPVMIVEGLITIFCIGFIKKVQPTLLPGFKK